MKLVNKIFVRRYYYYSLDNAKCASNISGISLCVLAKVTFGK